MSYLARNFAHEAEVRLLRWSDSPRGATITLELPPLEVGEAHPFKALEGVRFRMRFDVIRDDETVAPVLTAVKGPLLGLDPAHPTAQPAVPSSARDAARERYRFTLDAGQKAVVRASLMCREVRFWRWQEDRPHAGPELILTQGESAAMLRKTLGIKSRSEIASDKKVFRRFLDIELAYRGHAEERG